MVYPIKFHAQSNLSSGAHGDSLMDEVEDVYLNILYALMSISVEMSRHLGLLCIVCHLIEVPLIPLFQTVLGLANILFSASCVGYTVQQIVVVAADVVSCSVFLAPD